VSGATADTLSPLSEKMVSSGVEKSSAAISAVPAARWGAIP
jgi:hypothetical protein